jgi:hypothetical protein
MFALSRALEGLKVIFMGAPLALEQSHNGLAFTNYPDWTLVTIASSLRRVYVIRDIHNQNAIHVLCRNTVRCQSSCIEEIVFTNDQICLMKQNLSLLLEKYIPPLSAQGNEERTE